jgi:hypothetical protein
MGYYVDLENISINKYKEILKSADLLPSRMILKDNIDHNFSVLNNQKVQNVEELMEILKSKNKLQDFSKRSGLSEEFLTILIREIKSYRQTPNKLKDFPCIAGDVVTELENVGIRNTLQLFDKVITIQGRKDISSQTGIKDDEVLKLTKLADLSRIRWVNHTFAYVLLEAKYDTAEKVANADFNELYEAVKQLNEKRNLYKGHIGLHDMKLCIEAAKDLSLDIKY